MFGKTFRPVASAAGLALVAGLVLTVLQSDQIAAGGPPPGSSPTISVDPECFWQPLPAPPWEPKFIAGVRQASRTNTLISNLLTPMDPDLQSVVITPLEAWEPDQNAFNYDCVFDANLVDRLLRCSLTLENGTPGPEEDFPPGPKLFVLELMTEDGDLCDTLVEMHVEPGCPEPDCPWWICPHHCPLTGDCPSPCPAGWCHPQCDPVECPTPCSEGDTGDCSPHWCVPSPPS